MTENIENIDLSNLMRSYDDKIDKSLEQLFGLKIKELNTNQTNALETMGIASRALSSILKGTSSRVDLLSLIKLSKFLEINQNDAIRLYLNSLNKTDHRQLNEIDRRKFIMKNFDLKELRKEGIIENISDFDAIESRLITLFNYNSIYDYRKGVLNPAFSTSKLYKKNPMVDYWIEYSREIFVKINNTNNYNRDSLIQFFPTIRWHTQDCHRGLWEVIRKLHKIGVSVVYLPKFKKLHIRGATFSVNKKPCIVLTDYKGYYPTLWFSLLHELHHVLFDWEIIRINSFHISDKIDLYTEKEIEEKANQFARDYLFSEDKMNKIIPHLNNFDLVKEYTKHNDVHSSFPYIFHAYDRNSKGNWSWINKYMPQINDTLCKVKNISLNQDVDSVANYYNKNIYQ